MCWGSASSSSTVRMIRWLPLPLRTSQLTSVSFRYWIPLGSPVHDGSQTSPVLESRIASMNKDQPSTFALDDMEEPIRAELFSLKRLEQDAESLAAAQTVTWRKPGGILQCKVCRCTLKMSRKAKTEIAVECGSADEADVSGRQYEGKFIPSAAMERSGDAMMTNRTQRRHADVS